MCIRFGRALSGRAVAVWFGLYARYASPPAPPFKRRAAAFEALTGLPSLAQGQALFVASLLTCTHGADQPQLPARRGPSLGLSDWFRPCGRTCAPALGVRKHTLCKLGLRPSTRSALYINVAFTSAQALEPRLFRLVPRLKSASLGGGRVR